MRKKLVRTAALLWVFILPLSAFAEVAQPTPMPNTFVHDFAGVISDNMKADIQAKAQRLKDEYQTEIAVVTVESLQGEESFDYSMRMARSWGIGSVDNDIRGLLILVAIKERKTAFRTSRHIEGELPDGVTGEISHILPTLMDSYATHLIHLKNFWMNGKMMVRKRCLLYILVGHLRRYIS